MEGRIVSSNFDFLVCLHIFKFDSVDASRRTPNFVDFYKLEELSDNILSYGVHGSSAF